MKPSEFMELGIKKAKEKYGELPLQGRGGSYNIKYYNDRYPNTKECCFGSSVYGLNWGVTLTSNENENINPDDYNSVDDLLAKKKPGQKVVAHITYLQRMIHPLVESDDIETVTMQENLPEGSDLSGKSLEEAFELFFNEYG